MLFIRFNNNYKEMDKYNVFLIANGSVVKLEEETIDACKIEL